MTIAASVRAGRTTVERALENAHDRVYKLDQQTLVRGLAHSLGRPTLARLTGVPDHKTITRWALGRNKPSDARLELLRNGAVFYFALLELGLSEENAEQWFRGANPALGFSMPVDVLRERRYEDVAVAIGNHAGD